MNHTCRTSKTPSLLRKLLSCLPTLFLLSLIFGFSAQDGETSGSLSFQISLYIVELFSPLLPVVLSQEVLFERAELIHLFVRKTAHMAEYFLLALSLQLPLFAWFSEKLSTNTRLLIGFLATVLFAALDEFHQTFVPERSGNLTDVCIDSIGAIAASLCLAVFYSVHKQRFLR